MTVLRFQFDSLGPLLDLVYAASWGRAPVP